MSTIRSFLRPSAVALALAVTATSFNALAEGKDGRSCEHADLVGKHDKKAQFPLKADKFSALVEARIVDARQKMEHMLDKHAVPELLRGQMRKDFDDGATAVRAAAKQVAGDGAVSREEAKKVKELARELRRQAKAKYAPQVGKKAKKQS